MCVYDIMKELNITLPQPPPEMGMYVLTREFGAKLLYTSGFGPIVNGRPAITGKLGKDLSFEQGQEAARITMLNILSAVHAKTGDLNKVAKVVKLLGFVACSDEFYDQPKVMNAASQILADIFGEKAGIGARSAIGVNVLPGNIPVEIEVIFELKPNNGDGSFDCE